MGPHALGGAWRVWHPAQLDRFRNVGHVGDSAVFSAGYPAVLIRDTRASTATFRIWHRRAERNVVRSREMANTIEERA